MGLTQCENRPCTALSFHYNHSVEKTDEMQAQVEIQDHVCLGMCLR